MKELFASLLQLGFSLPGSVWIGVALVLFTSFVLILRYMRIQSKSLHAQKVAWVRLRRQMDECANEQGTMEPSEVDFIVSLPLTTLLEKYRHGDLRCIDVLRAYISKCTEAQNRTNCLTAVRFGEALQEARMLDQYFAVTGKLKGPLHGVPVSIKDCLDVQGLVTSIGNIHRINSISEKDSSIVNQLKRAGAIILCKTNVPQTLLSFECSNPLYGTTLNPFDSSRTCGGSSGGEAACLASYGSLIGIGTDIGGSLRFPAHFCGICSLKVTQPRLPERGLLSSTPGQVAVSATSGPMARSASELVEVMRVLWSPDTLSIQDDVNCPMPFSEELFARSPSDIRIGYMLDDGLIKPSKANVRAVKFAAEHLRSMGYSVTSFQIPNAEELLTLYFHLVGGESLQTIKNSIKGTKVDPTISYILRTSGLPKWIISLYSKYLHFRGAKLMSKIFENFGSKSLTEFYALQVRKKAAVHCFLDAMNDAGIDIILSPVHATTALPHQTSGNIPFSCSYSMYHNVTNFPAGVVPMIRVAEEDQSTPDELDSVEPFAIKLHALNCKQGIGIPCGVQVIGRPFCDELVMRVMSDLPTFEIPVR